MMKSEGASKLFDVPVILGMMRLLDYPDLASPKALAGWIEARIGEGLPVFDHADIYGGNACELAFGEAMSAAPALRRQVRVISKADIVPQQLDTSDWRVKHYNTSGTYVTAAIDASLRRLRVETLDLFLIHRPDPLMPLAETARALEEAVKSGKVQALGVSNFLPEQWRFLQSALSRPLICNQIELSLRASTPLFDGTHEALQRDGLRLLAWSPLAGGRLQEGVLAETLAEVSAETGLSATALAMAWLRRLPGQPVPVIGSLREERIADAVAGAGYEMPRALWFRLLEAARGHRVA
ncbi:aldo/keto reductase [Mangrovitalea sediminis]|uniref:aldo/keto reductase n=1 Tax=Mangrovitalea sediminis TaxID=1982043 RepID=UPI001D0D248D|nr:aldo/keto reductase [Mangrovitalea sediminis]